MNDHESRFRTVGRRAVAISALLAGVSGVASAQGGQAANPQAQGDTTLRFEIFGFAQGDIGTRAAVTGIRIGLVVVSHA